jgi:hypothetical protein
MTDWLTQVHQSVRADDWDQVIDEDECQEDVDEDVKCQKRKRGVPPYANATLSIFTRYI